MTKVVNLRRDPYDVYIGRAKRDDRGRPMKHSGYFGNPFPINARRTREQSIAAYKPYFARRLAQDPIFRQRLEALRGKVLGCFCAPPGGVTCADKPYVCHGQVIVEYLDALLYNRGQDESAAIF